MTKEITALTLVSTALDVLEKYKCQELFETMAVRGIKPVKHEIDDILSELIVEEVKQGNVHKGRENAVQSNTERVEALV